MEPLDFNQLTSTERTLLEYIAFNFVQLNKYWLFHPTVGRTHFSDAEFKAAVELFESKGWFENFYQFSRKGEIDAQGKLLHPIIWMEVLKNAKNSKVLAVKSSWSSYQILACHALLGEKSMNYEDSVRKTLEYEGAQPFATYLVWTFFTTGLSKAWINELSSSYYYTYLEWTYLQLYYSIKIAASTCFLYYEEKEVDAFRKYAIQVPGSHSLANVHEIEDCLRFNWEFLLTGSAQEAIQDSHEETTGTAWLCAVAFLRQQDYKKAFRSLKTATKQKAWCSGYRSALEDLISGLILYRNREVPAAKKKIEEINDMFHSIRPDKYHGVTEYGKQHACTLILSRLCLNHLTAKELTDIWNHFSDTVDDDDRRIVFGLLMGYLGIKEAVLEAQLLIDDLPMHTLFLESELFALKKKYDLPLTEDELENEPDFYPPLITDIQIKQDYEIAISQLSPLIEKMNATAGTSTRVVYLVDGWTIILRLQKSTRNGWGALSPFSWKSFFQGTFYMDDLDRQIALLASTPNNNSLLGPAIIKRLAGCNRVFDQANPDRQITVQNIKLELTTNENSDGSYTFTKNVPVEEASLVNEPPEEEGIWWSLDNTYFCRQGETIKICTLTEDQKKLVDVLSQVSSFPKSVKDDLLRILEAVSLSTTIMSDLLQDSKRLPVVQGLSALTVQIKPEDEYFDVKAVLRLAEKSDDFSCKPGVGAKSIAKVVEGRNVRIDRDLEKEQENLDAFLAAMEPFNEDRYDETSWSLSLPEMLELLQALQQLGEETVRVEWPEGAEFKIRKMVRTFEDFHMSLFGKDFWFHVDGGLKIEEGEFMKMSVLLDKVRHAQGRFIQLKGREFIALNAKLIKELKNLEEISSGKGDERLISRYGVGLLEALKKEGAQVESDGQYEGLMERIEKAGELRVEVPETFMGELRPYQKTGYEWMSRLAEWGSGGILADDMGLGKTIQAIALMGSRRDQGPYLIVCPSSVLINWQKELNKFDPALNVHLLNTGNRETILREAKSNDVVIATYGVMQSELARIVKVDWNIVFMDEAHTVKNKETWSSKCAKQIKAKAKFLLTGTPIQNRLSEIWNLFELANPGLLGTFTSFKDRFIGPIERDHNKERQELLKTLIRPFMLRRTKEEVVKELPERTEQYILVELSKDEEALYQNLRLEALQELETCHPLAIPFKVMKHLTKLRQAACHPDLVNPKLKIASSKTAKVLELVDDLLSEGHRALIFSQFTSHLALIKKELDARKIRYLYLDGSYSSKQRDELVKQFQTGNTPLFLISLKAGGVGMNLTAADYVIHLDPWWNPAIEDQASDRAHRIGQEKPVMIYKLISKNTIEEKILKMHESKKSLADALLEGSDVSPQLTKEEILNLLKANEAA